MLPPPPAHILERAKEAYTRWGIPTSYLEAPLEEETLASLLAHAEPYLQTHPHRVAPSSFDPESPLFRALPRPSKASWDSGQKILQRATSQGVLLCLPHFWQMEPLVQAACRGANTPLFVSDPDNLAVSATALISTGVDTIVAEPAAAKALGAYLASNSFAAARYWMLIHRPNAKISMFTPPIPSLGMMHEIHLFPGVPFAFQCAHLLAQPELLFHTSDAFYLERQDSHLYATTLQDDPLPLVRYHLSFNLLPQGQCGCGKERYCLA